jgi:Zn-dependent metalloprotease
LRQQLREMVNPPRQKNADHAENTIRLADPASIRQGL